MNGGEQVAQILKANQVTHIFTLCGGHISPILVEAKKVGIQVIDVRHEANAAFCADAYSRLTGKIGTVVVTAGPGVTNTITAIKNAQLAQSPLVLIGGATATLLRGRGSLQDIDQMEIIRPHVKWAARPNRLKELLPTVEKAYRIAKEGVPGPVFVELAVDLLYDESIVREWYKAKTEKQNPKIGEKLQSMYITHHLKRLFAESKISFAARQIPREMKATNREIKLAIKTLRSANRPVMIVGSQALLDPTTSSELVAALSALNIPVFLSGMARGLLGKDHRLQIRHKRTKALKEADTIILCGVPCDFRLNYGSPLKKAKVISINRSRDDLFSNIHPDIAILADPQQTIVQLAQKGAFTTNGPWLETLRKRHNERDQEIRQMAEEKTVGINPLEFCITMDTFLNDQSILIGDGGDFVASASYIIQPRKPYSWLDPGVFGTLGVGAGFAMSAKITNPEANVWLLYGDGAAGFSIMEFDSCARQNIPIIAVVGNDAGWTQIARDQVVILQDDVGTVLTHMDYHMVAKACGGHGILVQKQDEVEAALQEAIEVSNSGKPVLINVIIGKTDFRKGSISM
jgi:acetolactate synthase-like protein